MKDKGIRPEMEVFDLGMINYAKYLIERDCYLHPTISISSSAMLLALRQTYFILD